MDKRIVEETLHRENTTLGKCYVEKALRRGKVTLFDLC